MKGAGHTRVLAADRQPPGSSLGPVGTLADPQQAWRGGRHGAHPGPGPAERPLLPLPGLLGRAFPRVLVEAV